MVDATTLDAPEKSLHIQEKTDVTADIVDRILATGVTLVA